jgi:hypothetical protein
MVVRILEAVLSTRNYKTPTFGIIHCRSYIKILNTVKTVDTVQQNSVISDRPLPQIFR